MLLEAKSLRRLGAAQIAVEQDDVLRRAREGDRRLTATVVFPSPREGLATRTLLSGLVER